MSGEKINIVWIKRDLRTQDHEPLFHAENNNIKFLPIYIYEPSLIEHPDSSLRHHQFTYQSIIDINRKLKNFNKEIIVFHQETLKVFEYLNETFEIINVYSYKETGILKSWNRDKLVHHFFKKHNISWKEFQNNGVIRGIQNRNEWDKQWYAKMNT